MPHHFSKRSRNNLEGVSADLTIVASTAILISPVDFAVTSGLRTVAEQRILFNKGASQIMNSRHLTGHAIDLAPYINGDVSWDWPLFDDLAIAMAKSARWHKIPLNWGGADWGRIDTLKSKDEIEERRAAYISRKKAQGKKAFFDGPHFEIPR